MLDMGILCFSASFVRILRCFESVSPSPSAYNSISARDLRRYMAYALSGMELLLFVKAVDGNAEIDAYRRNVICVWMLYNAGEKLADRGQRDAAMFCDILIGLALPFLFCLDNEIQTLDSGL